MKMWFSNLKLSSCVLVIAGFLMGCLPHETPRIQFLPHMHRSQALRTYRGYNYYPDGSSAHRPPEGTIPRNFVVYSGDLSESPSLINPLPVNKEVMERGQKVYNNTCIVCHGEKGLGDGSIIPKFGMRPPNLNAENATKMSDGMMFHIISKGRGLMGSYGSIVPPADRWAIVHYIRALQKANNATEEEFKKYQEGK